MKKFLIIAFVLLGVVMNAGAQNTKVSVSREGDTFISQSKVANSDQPTSYKWRDSEGKEYQIILHTYTKGEKAGKVTCYVWRKSKKTGKDYKYYLPNGEEIAQAIIKENS
jgi:hypothetical protein